jgi:calcium/calmodulin-dependent protein kinase I
MGNKIKTLRGDEIHKTYDFKETLGKGSFAEVKRAVRKKDKQDFAIKIISKSKLNASELAVIHDEVDIMHKIKHPNCVQLFEMFESKKSVYMVLELLTGGELFDRVIQKGSFSEKEAADLIRALAGALEYLHGVGIVHRDLKPENLIYASARPDSAIKITDFGLAKFAQNQKTMSTACGTPGYVAPEVLKNEPYGAPVDLWSLGVILYILLCGFPPFYHESTAALYKLIKRGQYDFPAPYWTDISDSAKNLVRSLLTVDPKGRATPSQVLAHPWISGGLATSNPLAPGFGSRIALMQAKRIFRRGVQSIIAVNKFVRRFGEIAAKANAEQAK